MVFEKGANIANNGVVIYGEAGDEARFMTPTRIVIYADGAEQLVCSRCGKIFTSRGLKDMTSWVTSYGMLTYVPRDDVLCYECEENDKMREIEANAKLVGGPIGEQEG